MERVSERELVEALREALAAADPEILLGIGDDAALLAALLLPLPEWRGDSERLVLAGGIALNAALLLPIGMHRGGFSTWLAFSVALAGTSGVALMTGFAKLAVPCGAVSFACGCMGLFALGQRPHRTLHAGIGGAIVIATCASLGAAGAYAFETGGVTRFAFGSLRSGRLTQLRPPISVMSARPIAKFQVRFTAHSRTSSSCTIAAPSSASDFAGAGMSTPLTFIDFFHAVPF